MTKQQRIAIAKLWDAASAVLQDVDAQEYLADELRAPLLAASLLMGDAFPNAVAVSPKHPHALGTDELEEALRTLLTRCDSLYQGARHDGLLNCDAIARARAALAKV